MEDMARLALVEQSVRHEDEFIKILYELLRHIGHILENPHDYELRTIKSNILKEMLKHDAFSDYLKYVGFESINSDFMYPKELTLSNLRMAQAAIERKINFCCGTMNNNRTFIRSRHSQFKRNILTPVHVIKSNNSLLVRIQDMFNNMLVYEDEDLQAYAREQIPIVTLQLMALDMVREQQKKLKTGEIKGQDMTFDLALLTVLMEWFKYKFFSWVDKPDCEICGGPTEFRKSENMKTETEICRVEVYKCRVCGGVGGARFPRYNNPRTLLRTRRGRCGEWANCFALLCRALGYETRYVLDMSDHVWCEVFDHDSNKWLHVDPCECKLDAPLIYEHGWKKQLTYVIAMSRDDLQDVTWRYTLDHKQALKRRNLCSETELIMSIMSLREHRQRQVSEARRRYLAKRTLEELVQLMVEKKPSDYESQGRISGSWKWRSDRGETGGHTFTLPGPGHYHLEYYPGQDKYVTMCDDKELEELKSWSAGAYRVERMFRKVEQDWRQVYLAREEGELNGSISWKLSVTEGLTFKFLRIQLNSALYENGVIKWTLKFDDEQPITANLGAITAVYSVHAFHIMDRQYERTALGDAIDKASLKLLKEAYASEQDKNIVSSPLAVMLLLSFYREGAGEESSKEVVKFLGGGNYSQFDNPYSRLSTSLSRINPDSFTLSNKMYVGNEYTLNDEFMFTSYWYRSEIDTIDFKDTKKAVEIINNWANQKTGGHIKSAVSEDAIDPDTAAALFNVIFFQGQWHVPFDASDTEEKDFHVDSETVVKKPTMRLEQPLYYTENKDLGARMVELPYIQYGFRMVVILPDKIDGLSSVLEKAAERGLLDDVFKLQPTEAEVNLEMPKFEIKSALDLNNLLPKIGVSRIFDEPAPGIVKDNNVKVSKAFQQAFIKVDEEGATAGAFTGMIIVPMSSRYEPPTPVEFKVDRPFAYLILYEDKIIFIGTYTH